MLSIGAASVAAILVVALIFVPGLGLSGSSTTQETTKSTSVPLTDNNHHSALDGLNLQLPASFMQITPQQAFALSGHVVHMNLVAFEKTITLPTGASGGDGGNLASHVIAYTFNGTIPGPVIRATQGDVIIATITDPATNTDTHSIDNHASVISALNFVAPASAPAVYTYYFVATQPGAWEYHCEGHVNDLAEHAFRGMHGIVIVDPANGYQGYKLTTTVGNTTRNHPVSADAKEVALDFGEYYLTQNADATKDGDFDWTAMYNHDVTYATINGIPYGYQPLALNPTTGNLPTVTGATPLQFNQGDHVRFFVLNSGDYPVNFHIVGEILDQVTQGGVVQQGVQTFMIGAANTAIIDVTFQQPGAFVIVNHDYSQLFKGQVAVVLVSPQGTSVSNPSNAVPPMGMDSIAQTTTPYTFGTPFNHWNGTSTLPCYEQPYSKALSPCFDTTN